MSSTPALDKFNEEIRKRYGITPEQSLQEMERLRSRTRHNEAPALFNAEQRREQRDTPSSENILIRMDESL